MIETKFKQTELGPIPEDWEVGTFADFLTTFSAGATPYRGIPDNFIGQIPWISSGELNYCDIDDTKEHISLDAQRNTHLTVHKPGTFLIAITGLEAAGTRGRCAFVKTPATTNQSCLAINSTDKMTVKYLFWFYRQWSDYLAFNFSQGSKQQSFTAEIAKKLPIYAPTNHEQENIAGVLNDIDALIRELDALIEKKRAVMHGTMQDLLTKRHRLSGYSGSWRTISFEDIGILIRGVGFSPEQSFTNHQQNIIPLLRANNIQNDGLKFDDKIYVCESCVKDSQILQEADILICSANGSMKLVGKSTIIPKMDKCTFGVFMTILRCKDKTFAKYVSYFMKSNLYKNQIRDLLCGSAINNLNSRQLYTIHLNYPTNKNELNDIVNILSDMDAEISELEAKREKYTSIRQGMMQQLLTGKIRLI